MPFWQDAGVIDETFGDGSEVQDGGGYSPSPFSIPSYSSVRPEDYRFTRQWARDTWGFSSVSDTSARVQWAAEQYYREFGSFPPYTTMQGYEPLTETLDVLASGMAHLPTFYSVDGVRYFNDAWHYPRELDRTHPAYAEMVNEQGQPEASEAIMPQWDLETFNQIRQSLSPVRASGGGGRGGGGGRTDIAWDERQMRQAATQRWKGYLLEDPEDIDSVVNDYMKEANSFWRTKGGNLDFDAFIVDRMRTTDRYNMLYGKMPQHMVEEQYISGYLGATAQYGFDPGVALREQEAAMGSGASVGGFAERLSRVREASYSGNFMQRMAASAAKLGPILRS